MKHHRVPILVTLLLLVACDAVDFLESLISPLNWLPSS
jgi:hypothetical protein